MTRVKNDCPMIAALLGEHAHYDPRYILDDGDSPLLTRLNHIHQELRASSTFGPLQRIAIALYDAREGFVRTFVESNIGIPSSGRYQALLSQQGSLRQMAQSRTTRIIDEVTSAAPGRLGDLYRKGIRSSMTVPIYGQGGLFGFIFFNAAKPRFFRGAIPDHLSLYARLIALLLIQEVMAVRLVRSVVKAAQELTRHRDYETATHLDRMSHYTRLIATEGADQWGLSDEFIEHLFWFAPLHDIGKIAVRDSILLKPGKLTETEMAEMKLHVTKGVEIIDGITKGFGMEALPYMGIARNVISFHHENVDGSGYPGGAMGSEIPIEGRIVAVADVFDALTSDRPYKQKWTNEDAIAYLRKLTGQKFDRDCVEAFILRMDEVIEIQNRFQCEIAP